MKIINVKKKSLRPIVKKIIKKYKTLNADLKARFHRLYPNAASKKPLYVYDADEKKIKVLPMNYKGVLYYVMYPLIVLRKKMKISVKKRLLRSQERRKLRIGGKDSKNQK